MERKPRDEERFKRYSNQQTSLRAYLDPDPNEQTVKVCTYLTFETNENLNKWVF